MKNDEQILESLIAGGLIGAALGALVTGSKKNSESGIIARAAILATFEAYEKARKTNIPLLIKKGNALCEMRADGSCKFIKSIPKSPNVVPKKFVLQE